MGLRTSPDNSIENVTISHEGASCIDKDALIMQLQQRAISVQIIRNNCARNRIPYCPWAITSRTHRQNEISICDASQFHFAPMTSSFAYGRCFVWQKNCQISIVLIIAFQRFIVIEFCGWYRPSAHSQENRWHIQIVYQVIPITTENVIKMWCDGADDRRRCFAN